MKQAQPKQSKAMNIRILQVHAQDWIKEVGLEGKYPIAKAFWAADEPKGLNEQQQQSLSQCNLVLVRGLPGAGKTTLAKAVATLGFRHFEADMYFEEGGLYKFNSRKLRDAHAWCLQLVRRSIKLGSRVIVANTFARSHEMLPYLQLVPTTLVIEMDGEWESTHAVSSTTIEKIKAEWQTLCG